MNFRGTPDWFGEVSPWNPEFSLEVKNGTLHYTFRVAKAAYCDDSLRPGSFVEGLWEKDVAELFLGGPGEFYQEINISPSGAWWSATFKGYRERIRAVEFPAQIEHHRTPDSWSVSFSAQVKDLEGWQNLAPDEFRVSPTAILYGPEPSFFAWNWDPDLKSEPDFHRKDLFKPLIRS
ncbi:MAG: hypothetical protein WC314_15920 [Vulcanimicrobiota bacterium]